MLEKKRILLGVPLQKTRGPKAVVVAHSVGRSGLSAAASSCLQLVLLPRLVLPRCRQHCCRALHARTTALQLLDNRCEAFAKVLAVCLAVLHGESARECRLPPRSGG